MSQKTVAAILDRFRELGIAARISTHPPVRTSEEAAAIRGVPLSSGVKALVCKTKEGSFILLLVKGDEKADLKRLDRLEGAKKLTLASPEEVLQLTDCEPGADPPFGFAPPLKTYFDPRIREAATAPSGARTGTVNFNIGLQTHSATIAEQDLEKALGAFVEY